MMSTSSSPSKKCNIANCPNNTSNGDSDNNSSHNSIGNSDSNNAEYSFAKITGTQDDPSMIANHKTIKYFGYY